MGFAVCVVTSLYRGVGAMGATRVGAGQALDAVGRSALRKASWRLVPLIGLGYGAAYMDRVNLSFAQETMSLDLHFNYAIYGLGAGLFFVSYALCEIPSNLLLVRFGARRWLSRIMLTWGLLAMGMLFVRTPHAFYAMRFLLGMAEAGFFPGVVYYLTEWFPPEWRARTVSRFYIALPLSSTVMGSLAGWLLSLNGRLGLHGWQWVFAVEGLPPVLLSAIFWIYLPDAPKDARWLTEEERSWLEGRLAEARVGTMRSTHTGADLRGVLGSLRLWLLGLFFLCTLTVLYGWTFSAPLILKGLTGWSASQIGWTIAAMGLAGAVGMLATSESSDRSGERTWHIVVPMLAMAAAYAVGGLTRQPWLGLAALTAGVVAYNCAQGPVLTLPSTFLTGRTSAIGYAAMTAIGIGGGFLGPAWMNWARQLTGDYQRGLLLLAVPSIVAGGLILWLKRIQGRG